MAIFAIDNDHIKNLGEVDLPKLIYQIMYYEIAKLNLLNQGLHISLETKASDGGSDGEFNAFEKKIPDGHNFLPNKNIVFQFKAAKVEAKSWFEKEIIDKNTNDLKPKLKEYIDKDYLYMLITNKTDLPANKLEFKEKILKEVFTTAGYPDVSVKIIDLSKLAEWANSIPQIYLTLNPDTKYFELFDKYTRDIEKQSKDVLYVNDENRKNDIEQIRSEIKTTLTSSKSAFIRVEGFSGIGKTRFIYETLNDDKYKEFVLYVQSHNEQIFGDLLKFCKKLPNNSQEVVIFVIDECPYDEHVRICRGLKDFPNLIVITINQLFSEQDKINCEDEKKISLKGLSEEKTVELIQRVNPILNNDVAKKIAYYTEGYPRLAYFMAQSYDIEIGDTTDFDEKSKLLDRILKTITDDAEDIIILQAISIFKLFPYRDDMREYKTIIFEHFGIDRATAPIIINQLVEKEIIRNAGRFLYISPRPISIHLFNQFLSNSDYDFIDELFKKLNNQGLMNSFFDKLQGVEFNLPQHKELLFQILSKLTYEQINEELGAKIFYTLCLKDRSYSISILNDIFRDKSKEDLIKFENGRRYIVFSLEELISFEDTFIDAAKILFRLAIAENETWGNNSKGIFKASFTWMLSGTEVNIINRLNFLKELYKEYIEDKNRLILLDSLASSYPKWNYTATYKNYANIPENIPESYYPKTQEEIDKYFIVLKQIILFMYDNSSNKLKLKITNDLISSLRIMINYTQIDIWLLDFIESSLNGNTDLKANFFEQISFIIKYDKDDKISKGTLKYLEKLSDRAFDIKDIDSVKEVFYATQRYRYNDEETFDIHCKILAKDILNNRNYDILLDVKSSNVSDIGVELASLDKENILYNDTLELISKVDKNSNLRFITSYIFNNKMSEESKHQNLFNEIYKRLNDKSLMFEFIHSSNIQSATVIEYIYILLEKKEIDSSLLEKLTYGFWLRDFTKDNFIKFIDKINIIIEKKCDSFDLCMQYIHSNKEKELIEKYTIYYIENAIFNCPDNNRSLHYIDNMIDDFFSINLKLSTNTLKEVWKSVLFELDNDGKFEANKFNSVYKILKKYPDFFWNSLQNSLDNIKPSGYPIYAQFIDFMQGGYLANTFEQSIFNHIDSTQVIEWLKVTEYKNAKYIVADSLNIDFKSSYLPEIVIQLLTEFSNDKDLYNSIIVTSEGWSGSYVPVANEKISNIESMIEMNNSNKSVVHFLKWVKKGLESRRDSEKMRDAERNIY